MRAPHLHAPASAHLLPLKMPYTGAMLAFVRSLSLYLAQRYRPASLIDAALHARGIRWPGRAIIADSTSDCATAPRHRVDFISSTAVGRFHEADGGAARHAGIFTSARLPLARP